MRFIKAGMGGVMLSFGGTLVHIMTANPWLSDQAPGLLRILEGAVFPIGLIMTVLFQADLVTSQMGIMIMATIKGKVPLWAFAVDWVIVFFGNLVGALAYGYMSEDDALKPF